VTEYGGGTGTPTGGSSGMVISGNSISAVSLVDYAALVGYRECAFFGVNHPDNAQYACREIWTQSQRTMVADALAQAQEMIEIELGYFLVPKWTTAERHVWACPILTDHGYVIAPGVVSDTLIEAGSIVNYGADPAVVIVNGVTCAAGNIHVFHAGTNDEILPTAMTLVAGLLTISIPWCRLVDPANWDNPEAGWSYTDMSIYATEVDVRCITNDESVNATIICRDRCTCGDTRHSGCMYVRQPKIGSVSVSPADYVGGAWVKRMICCHPGWVELNYLSGKATLDRSAEMAIVRLAHSLLPSEPCGCDIVHAMWARDREVPTLLTRERLNCPFGVAAGAWFSWVWTARQALRRGSVL
jgi:hypothetical protein